LQAKPGSVRPEGRRPARLHIELPGLQRREDDRRQQQSARDVVEHDQSGHDHDRRQRRRLQQRDHQLRALLLHLWSAINEANSFIANKLPGLLDTTYNNIRSRATTAHVVVLGYPHLFTAEGKTCNVNFLTSSNEKKLNETGDKLDGVIKARAAAHGFTFVDSRAAFLPHEVCSSEEWLNGQSNPLEESYHPNVKGQKEFSSEVEAVLP